MEKETNKTEVAVEVLDKDGEVIENEYTVCLLYTSQTVFRGRNGTLKSRICGYERCHFFIHKTPPIAGA